MPTIKELADAAAEWNDAVERLFSHTPTTTKEEALAKRQKYENLRDAAIAEWMELKSVACTPASTVEVQMWEAKLQRQQELDARVNDLYARMQAYSQALSEQIDAIDSQEGNFSHSKIEGLYDDAGWAEAWLEALEWVRGDRTDPLMEGLTPPLP
jgi:hypothetical protein